MKNKGNDLELKKKITIVASLTTLLGILTGLIGLGILGVSLHYHPRPKPEALGWLAILSIASIMPVIITWVLKFQFIRWRWMRAILVFLLAAYGCFLAIFMGEQTLTDSGDFLIWFPVCLYGVLQVLAAYLFVKRDAS